MTGKERLTAALTGDKVDRAPLWVREGLEYRAYEHAEGSYRAQWKTDPEYRRLNDYIYQYADVINGWSFYPLNRFMCTDHRRLNDEKEILSPDVFRTHTHLDIQGGEMVHITETHRGEVTSWHKKCIAEDLEDLYRVMNTPLGSTNPPLTPPLRHTRRFMPKRETAGLSEPAPPRRSYAFPIVCLLIYFWSTPLPNAKPFTNSYRRSPGAHAWRLTQSFQEESSMCLSISAAANSVPRP